jgi:hypothetical protein
MAEFTAREKLAEIEREIAMRKRVYPGLIAKGALTLVKANRQIEVMRAIAQDYQRGEADEQSILSGG